MSVPAPTLTGRHVQLEQLRIEFAEELTAAGNEERSSYGWTPVPPTVDGMQRYIAGLLDDQEARTVVPFVQRRISDGALVGCTRYLRLEWWGGGDLPAEVEIGGTWLAASAQRTAINTEAKLLMLTHAFEVWGCHRVTLKTDARNLRSRAGIEGIGGKLDGILRAHMPAADGGIRDTALYSIVAGEWPAVKARLVERLR
jgi:RimJ/RimL family protein N-acetyltransferase